MKRLLLVLAFIGCRKDDLPAPAVPLPVILVDFDGHAIRNSHWNIVDSVLYLGASGMTAEQNSAVLAIVEKAFAGFPVRVTANEAVYNEVVPARRTRLLITASHQWYGTALGGAARTNSWGKEEVGGFVFSALNQNNVKHIGESAVHEIGHIFGLRHRAVYDTSCRKLTDYDRGDGITAPYMGDSRNARDGGSWGVGPIPLGCKNIQHERDTIISRLTRTP